MGIPSTSSFNAIERIEREIKGGKMAARSITIPCLFLPFLLLLLLLLISSIHTTTIAAATTPTSSKSNDSLKIFKNFIKFSCNTTTYPTLCYKSLSPYASTIKTDSLKLRKVSLNVNLKAANKTYSLLSSVTKKRQLNPSEKAVTEDCIEEIADCIDELKQASRAVAKLARGENLEDPIADILTWVSAAMTDEDTCIDGFDDEMKNVRSSVKNSISKSVMDLGKVTSNTLALVNGLRY